MVFGMPLLRIAATAMAAALLPLATPAFAQDKGNPFLGVASCESCHGPKGEGTVQLPRLAGQHAAYLQSQLKEFNARERTNDNAVMHAIASRLTELETRAVAVYLSGQL